MNVSDHPALRNRILALLPSHEFVNVADALQFVELPKGEVIARANGVIEYVYFLCSGIGSVVTASKDGQRAEAGMVGRARVFARHPQVLAAPSACMKC